MSSCDRKKEIRIELNNGMNINLPKQEIKRIVLPGVMVENHYHRLVLNMENYLESMKRFIKRQ